MKSKNDLSLDKVDKIIYSNRFAYWAAFTFPLIIMLIVFYYNQIVPFGDNTVMTRELFNRFVPFFSELQRKILSGDSLFYSWNILGGINFWYIIGQYLSSPFTLLLLPFSARNLPLALSVVVLLRTCLSALFMSIFIRKKEPKTPIYQVLFFSTAYSLCGYAAAYFWAFMWIDVFVFFPLLILGTYQIYQGKKPLLYILILFLTFLSDFRLGVICFIFTFLFVVLLFTEDYSNSFIKKSFFIVQIRMLFSGLLAVGLASFILFPAMRALSQVRLDSDIDYYQSFYAELNIFDVGTRLFYGAHPAVDFKMPNIYISMIALVLVPLYCLCEKMRLMERLISVSIALAIYVFMTSRVLNYWFEGMQFAERNHYRYAFLLSFLLLYMGFRVIKYLNIDSKKNVIGVLLGIIIYVMIYNQTGQIKPETERIYAILFFLLAGSIMWICFSIYRKQRHFIGGLLLLFICLELFAFSVQSYEYSTQQPLSVTRTRYQSNLDIYEQIIREESERVFSRNVVINAYSEFDGALFGYSDMGGSYDLQNRGFRNFMYFLGLVDQNGHFDEEGMFIFQSHLMSIQKVYQRTDVPIFQNNSLLQDTTFDFVTIIEDNSIFDWKDVRSSMSPGICVDKDVRVLLSFDRTDNFREWNMWLEYLDFEPVFLSDDLFHSEMIDDYANESNEQFKHLQINANTFDQYIAAFKERSFDIDEWGSGKINGRVRCNSSSSLVLMVPFDEGWEATVNGVPVQPFRAFGGLLAVFVSEGDNTIQLQFQPAGIKTGALLSIFSLAILLLVTIVNPFNMMYESTSRKTLHRHDLSKNHQLFDISYQVNCVESKGSDEK